MTARQLRLSFLKIVCVGFLSASPARGNEALSDPAREVSGLGQRFTSTFFVTNRAVIDGSVLNGKADVRNKLDRGFSTRNSGEPFYGIAKIAFPVDRRLGSSFVGNASSKKDPSYLYGVQKAGQIDKKDFAILVERDLKRMNNSQAPLIYVHGFNTSLEDAVLNLAQIKIDAHIATTVLFSWPGNPVPKEILLRLPYINLLPMYLDAEKQEPLAEKPFADLLSQLSRKTGEKPNLLAHSMGSRVIFYSLKDLFQFGHSDNPIPPADQVIFAAPDIPLADLERDKLFVAPLTEGFEIFCAADRALWAAENIVDGRRRAGLCSDPKSFVDGIPVIFTDVSSDRVDWVRHSYFLSTPLLLHQLEEKFGRRPYLTISPK